MSASLFDHRRQQYTRSFCCGVVCPWSWRDWACTLRVSRVVRHFLLHGGTLTCKKYLGEDNMARLGSAVSLHRPVRAVPLSIDPDIAPFSSIRSASSTKDRKKGCAYDPGAIMIQGALQNQTLRYMTVRLRNPCERSWAMGADMAAPGDFFLEVWTKMFLRTRSRYRHGNK